MFVLIHSARHKYTLEPAVAVHFTSHLICHSPFHTADTKELNTSDPIDFVLVLSDITMSLTYIILAVVVLSVSLLCLVSVVIAGVCWYR